MDTVQAQTSLKNLTAELFSLNPSAIITMFEINLEDILFNQGLVTQSEIDQEKLTVFRFHNSINLTSNSIFWQGKQYIAAPIHAEGFETSLKGSTPTPKLSMSVSDEGIPLLAQLKDRLVQMGDIVGAKVTRIRTFSRFLDASNFVEGIPPKNFYPDPNSELPRDIYYIDRKSQENKNTIEYELAPIFETEGIKLPGRMVVANTCTANYRGESCLYEYSSRKNLTTHGDGTLPSLAPPVANEHNEEFSLLMTGIPFSDMGEYNLDQVYKKGDFVYIEHRDIKYYFISKVNNNASQPPDTNKWIEDKCSKNLVGCRLRWSTIANGTLPFCGFPSCIRSK